MLAVNTAGMLVRRGVLEELGGLDAELPIFGNDIDFGWRAALAGHRTLVVPAGRGLPRRGRPPRRPSYAADRAPHALPGAAGRAAHLAGQRQLARPRRGSSSGCSSARCCGCSASSSCGPWGRPSTSSPRSLSVHGRPRQVAGGAPVAGRSCAGATRPDVRRLLAPPWLPYRHGLDFVTDLAAAATNQAADVAERRRAARAGAQAPGTREERRDVGRRRGRRLPHRLRPRGAVLHQPGRASCWSLFAVLAFVAGREAFGSITGGALSPVPDGRGRLVAAARRVLAPARAPAPTCRPRRTCCRSPSSPACSSATPGPWSAALMLLAVPDRGLGRVAAAQGRGPPRRPARAAPLAAGVGCADLRAGPGDVRGVGRGPLRHRGRCRAPAVDRARRPRLRRPRPRPPLAGRVAYGAARWPSARPSCPGSGSSRSSPPRSSSARPHSSPRVCCATATAGGRRSWPWPPPRCCSRRGSCRCSRPGSAAGLLLESGRLTGRPGDVRRAADRPAQRPRRPVVAGRRARPARPRSPSCRASHARAGAGLLAGRAGGRRRVRPCSRPRHARPAGRDDAAEPRACSSSSCRAPSVVAVVLGADAYLPPARRPPPGVAARCSRSPWPSSPRSSRSAASSGGSRAPQTATTCSTRERVRGARLHGAELAARSRARRAGHERLGRGRHHLPHPSRRRHHAGRGRDPHPRRRGRRPHRGCPDAGLLARARGRRGAGRQRAWSTSSSLRPPTVASPRCSTRPPASTRPAPRTAPPARGASTDRSTRTRSTGATGWWRTALLVVQAVAVLVALVLAAPTVRERRRG